jgi:hypothetical protein
MKEEFDKELRELSPLLAYLKKEQEADSFKVPKFYFDNLADKVIAQARETDKIGTHLKKETPQLLRASQGQSTFLGRLQDFLSDLLSPRLALALGSCLIVAVAAWFMLTPKKSTITVGESTASTTMPTSDGQLPTATGQNGTSIVDKSASLPQNKTNAPENVEKSPKSMPNEVTIKPQNSVKSNDTEGGSFLATNIPLTHPKSGLTEEELALYLEENAEEIDTDGSDNNL